MAWFAGALPYLAAGASAVSTYTAGRQNAKTLKMQSIAANQQSVADEEATRRRARQILGMQRAAIAESGLGYEGSAGLIAQQSAANAELDALNTRYNGYMRALGLLSDSGAVRRESSLLAGQKLLQGSAAAYTSGARISNPFRTRPAYSQPAGWIG